MNLCDSITKNIYHNLNNIHSINNYTIEQIEVGMTDTVTHLVTVEDVKLFSKLTGDNHPLHTSSKYAKENGFENIIAHGLLISSYASTLVGMKMPGENAIVLSQNFTYKKPVYPGDKLNIKGLVVSKDVRFSLIELKVQIFNQNELKVAIGQFKIKLRN